MRNSNNSSVNEDKEWAENGHGPDIAETSAEVDPGAQSRTCMAATLAQATDPDIAAEEKDMVAVNDALARASAVRITCRGAG